ncbi:histidine phosphatase superfamily [Haematococcus lacustris]
MHARGCSVGRAVTAHATGEKLVYLMRHGTTELNVYLQTHQWDAPDFVDPMLFDTRLTLRGVEGARAAAHEASMLHPAPELLVVSPLARALQTATLAFLPHYSGPVMVEALARERVYMSGDCGSVRSRLQAEFPRFQLDHLPDIWWWTGGSDDPRAISLEPEEVFAERIEQFRRWLLQRPESVIAVVAHWGVIMQLTGHDFENCELRSYCLHPDKPQLQPLARQREGEPSVM